MYFIKKELIYIVSVFLILTILMHYEAWLSYPLKHLEALSTSGAYGFGIYHPLIFTLIIYLILWLPRGIVRLFRKKRL